MAKRISRAKQRTRQAGARFELPPQPQRTERLAVVLHVLYLVFNDRCNAGASKRYAHTCSNRRVTRPRRVRATSMRRG